MARAGPILLVEDDVPLREELRALLEAAGYPVIEAGDGLEALEILRHVGDVRLVVLDIILPVMSGWELLSRLRNESDLPAVPVIIMSARPVARVEDGPPVFRKPLDIDRFIEAVRALADNGPAPAKS